MHAKEQASEARIVGEVGGGVGRWSEILHAFDDRI